MTDRLKEIRERLEKAAPGPWKAEVGNSGARILYFAPNRYGKHAVNEWELLHWHEPINKVESLIWDDADFIAHAREDIPYLLAEIERVTAERDRARALVKQYEDEEVHEAMECYAAHKERDRLRAALEVAKAALNNLANGANVPKTVTNTLNEIERIESGS